MDLEVLEAVIDGHVRGDAKVLPEKANINSEICIIDHHVGGFFE